MFYGNAISRERKVIFQLIVSVWLERHVTPSHQMTDNMTRKICDSA